MQYEIKTPAFTPAIIFREDELIIGKKSIPYSQITGLKIAIQPTKFANGIARCRINGKKTELLYSSKSTKDMEKAVSFVNEKIKSMNKKWTAEELYELADDSNYIKTIRQKQAIRNFGPAADALMQNEEVVFAFTGGYKKMNAEDSKKVKGNCSFVATKERMLISQGANCFVDTVFWNEVKEITIREIDLLGLLIMKLDTGVVSISVDCKVLKNIYVEVGTLVRTAQ